VDETGETGKIRHEKEQKMPTTTFALMGLREVSWLQRRKGLNA